jgi:hypothetical protein
VGIRDSPARRAREFEPHSWAPARRAPRTEETAIEPIQAGPASGPLLLADISGYTSFLQAVEEAHRDDAFAGGHVPDAYGLVSSLLDGIVERIVPPFTLSKIEGDAVFAFAPDGEDVPRGAALLDCLAACYAAFRDLLAGAEQVWTCRCNACSRVSGLDLKFVLHAGSYVVQSIAGGRELVGPEVVIAHRLLKNHAAEVIGRAAYALITEAAATRLAVPLGGARELTETYDHYPPIAARVYPL